mmetsp:Transcript_19505/g.58027  ORF Transcript_19505/g.58027 Transcript_19505/m.58027 type:complete len:137 (-) Transcript_19505:85-495(-)
MMPSSASSRATGPRSLEAICGPGSSWTWPRARRRRFRQRRRASRPPVVVLDRRASGRAHPVVGLGGKSFRRSLPWDVLWARAAGAPFHPCGAAEHADDDAWRALHVLALLRVLRVCRLPRLAGRLDLLGAYNFPAT